MQNRTFQLIDLDRTLFDTSKFAKAITNEVDKAHPGLGIQLDAQFEAAYKKEETFFVLRFLRGEMGDEAFEQLVSGVVEAYGPEGFVLQGARERLELAKQFGAWAILTFGDLIDQRMKLRIMGIEGAPMYLSEDADKARLIATWKLPSGEFQVPAELGGGVYDTLTFEDDKLRAFIGLPEGVSGLWLTSAEDAPERLAGVEVGSTRIVHDLYESMAAVRKVLE